MRKSSRLIPLIAAGTFLIPTAAWAQGAEGEALPPAEAPPAEAPPVEAAPTEAPPAEPPAAS